MTGSKFWRPKSERWQTLAAKNSGGAQKLGWRQNLVAKNGIVPKNLGGGEIWLHRCSVVPKNWADDKVSWLEKWDCCQKLNGRKIQRRKSDVVPRNSAGIDLSRPKSEVKAEFSG